MKILLLSLLALITVPAFAQPRTPVQLAWKIGKNERVSYLTVMNDIDTGSVDINFDGLFNALADSTKSGLAESKSLLSELNKAFINQDFISVLSSKGNGVIDVIVASKPKQAADDSAATTDAAMQQLFQSMTRGVVLRGSVNANGGIHSFWVKGPQKNLIALLFELPSKPVQIGDKWSLDISLIANDQNFDCDSSKKINEVTLVDLKRAGNETVAVLRYNILEYVKGKFYSPFGKDDGGQETIMRLSHRGTAEFSVDKGRWISYDGIMHLEASGVMTADKKTKLTLVKVEK